MFLEVGKRVEERDSEFSVGQVEFLIPVEHPPEDANGQIDMCR